MMKICKKIIWCSMVLFLGVSLFSACGKPEIKFEKTLLDDLTWYEVSVVETLPLFEQESEKNSYWIYPEDEFVTEGGRIRFSQERFVLEFSDWITDEVYPLCIKTNCNHNDNSCNAYFPFEKGRPMCLYYNGQFLYYEYSTNGEQTEWYRQNLDGSDRTKIFSLNEDFENSWVVYNEDIVYFVTYIYEINKEVNTDTGEQEGIVKYHIYAGNLETGEVQPFAYEFSGDLISLQLLGMYEEQLMVSYASTTSLEPLDSLSRIFLYNVTEDRLTGVSSWDSSLNIAPCPDAVSDGVYAFLELDMETEKMVDNHAYYEGKLNILDLKNGYRYVLEKQAGLDYNLEYLDGKLFYSTEDKQNIMLEAYDLSTSEKIVIPEQTADLILDGEVGEWFYGRIISENGTFISFHILKNNYYEGNRDLILEN